MDAMAPVISVSKAKSENFITEVKIGDDVLVPVYCLTETANHIRRHIPHPIHLAMTLRMIALILNREPMEAQRGRDSISQATYYVPNMPTFNLGDMAISICVNQDDDSAVVIFGQKRFMDEAGLLAPVGAVS
jgi:hypothetical protein